MNESPVMSTNENLRWVEIQWLILSAKERSTNLPADTRDVPYLARARGLGLGASSLGDVVEITTQTGRRLTGVLVEISPGYFHTFGRPLDAWVTMRENIRATVEGDKE